LEKNFLNGIRRYHVRHHLFGPLRINWYCCGIVNFTIEVMLNFIWLMSHTLPQANSYSHLYRCMSSSYLFQSLQLLYSQASRLSMSIRAITVERGIATLAYQSGLSTIFSSYGSRNRHNAGVGEIGASTVDAISSPTGVPAIQEEEELEGGYYDDEEDEEIIQEDRSMTRGEDVERAIA
jgi:hypothetical protein